MDNPFKPSFGNRPDKVVGREEVLDELETGLADDPGSHRRANFIIGQRGMGKTALLLEVESRASKGHYVAARTIANESMLENLIERLQIVGNSIVKESKKPLSGFSVGAFGFSVGLNFTDEIKSSYGFETKLGMLCDRLAECGKGVLLLVDEVRSTSPEMRQLASAYQNLVGDGKDVAICMAGLPASISTVLNDDVLTFLNRAGKVRLGPILQFAVRRYYADVIERYNRSIDEDALAKAVEATKGFPYLLQLIGFLLFEETREGDTIGISHVDRAVSDAREYMEDAVFAPTLDGLSPNDLAFLTAVALEGGRATVSCVEGRLNKDNRWSQQYRKRLIDAGVLASPRRGELEIVVPFLTEYLCNKAAE